VNTPATLAAMIMLAINRIICEMETLAIRRSPP
jgi:hypothetical protein